MSLIIQSSEISAGCAVKRPRNGCLSHPVFTQLGTWFPTGNWSLVTILNFKEEADSSICALKTCQITAVFELPLHVQKVQRLILLCVQM